MIMGFGGLWFIFAGIWDCEPIERLEVVTIHPAQTLSGAEKIDLLFIPLTAQIGKSHNSVHWGD